MAGPTHLQQRIDQVRSRLLGPRGQFEIVREEVRGVSMEVMKNRDHSLGTLLSQSRNWGDRDYIVTAKRRISYMEHASDAYSLAAALQNRYGVGKGDRVAILAANAPEWVTAFWATQALGAIAVGLNSWWVPREIEYGLMNCTPLVVIADSKGAALLDDVNTDGISILTMEDDLPNLIAQYPDAPVPEVEIEEDDPAAILYTSGTSGRPKGVLHSHRNFLAVVDYHRFGNAVSLEVAGIAYEPTSPSSLRYLLTSPLFHISSLHNLVVPRLATGGAVIMHQGAFDVDAVLALIEREKVTHWGAVPTMASRLLESGRLDQYDTSSVQMFTLASAPSSIALQDRLRDLVPFARNALTDSYGLTECSCAITVASATELKQYPGLLGKPIITVSMEIRDADGTVLPDGEEGEVWTRSPFVMLGYWNDPDATAAAITPDSWLRTGDFGAIENGRLRLSGRRSDLILRGGENVYPVEIEQVLDEHPEIVECAVIGTANLDLGQEVSAVVVIAPDAEVTEDGLREYAAKRLAYYKVPSRWRITTTPLPRNATGKMIRSRIEV